MSYVKLYSNVSPTFDKELYEVYWLKLIKRFPTNIIDTTTSEILRILNISERTWNRFLKSAMRLGIILRMDNAYALNPLYSSSSNSISLELVSIFKMDEAFRNSLSNTHKTLYNYYSQEVYNDSNSSKVLNNCDIHGDYLDDVFIGNGCPYCNMEKLNKYKNPPAYFDKPTIFYIIKIEDFYKIGITTKSVEDRYKYENVEYMIIFKTQFNTGKPAFEFEQWCTSNFYQYKYKGKSPFRYTGVSEIFSYNISEDVRFLEYCKENNIEG